jgi:hypothetical protein
MSRRKGAPWKHRPHHRAFYRLSAAARQRAVEGFRANDATTAIVAALAATFEETIPTASLNRYREWWDTTQRPQIEAAERTEELVRAFKDHPTPEIEAVIRQLLQAQRLNAMTEDKRPNPVELGWLDVEDRKLRLKEREVALRERTLERKVGQAAGKVEKELKRAKLDPETVRRIKEEIYGIPA